MSGAVRKILRNEKYCGDVLMQKTITIDYLSHQTKVNEGEAEQYFIADHHDPIVDKEVWNKAQEILDKTSWRRWKRREQQRLMPVKSGRLKGFVSISTEWKDVSVTRLISASKKVMTDAEMTDQIANDQTESEETIMAVEILEGFEEVQLEESKGDSVLTLTSTNIKFNKATAQELGFPAYVRMLINATTRQAAIQPCKENAKNAVPFSKDEKSQNYAVVIKIPALMTAIRKLADTEEENVALSFKGTLFPNDKIIIYDISKGEPVRRRGRKKKEDQPQAAEEQ